MNNKGMSLLELVIAMAISAIVIMMIVSFISAAFRVFRKTNDEVNLQMEAQTTINQLTNILMEAKKVEKSNKISTTMNWYLIDNIDLAGYNDYAIIFDHNDNVHKLYLVELNPGDTYDAVAYTDQQNLLTEYVDEFTITPVDGKDNIQSIYLKLTLGNEDYELTKQVKLRNFVTTP
jgi:prepilin-type N-terminal cleavage/methylation domain-containing protein